MFGTSLGALRRQKKLVATPKEFLYLYPPEEREGRAITDCLKIADKGDRKTFPKQNDKVGEGFRADVMFASLLDIFRQPQSNLFLK